MVEHRSPKPGVGGSRPLSPAIFYVEAEKPGSWSLAFFSILGKGMESMNETQRTWAEINVTALRQNFRNIRALLKPETKLLAVVKANGYGHGAYETAEIALENGADYLAVAALSEALELRQKGITAPILVLGYVAPEGFAQAITASVSLTVFDEETAERLSEQAQKLGRTAGMHIKADTGMGRIGFPITEAAADTVLRISRLPGLRIEGLFTHFALSDSADKSYTYRQFAAFQQFAGMLESRGIQIPLKHCANSAAIMELPEMQLDMVRSGIISYGLYPSDEVDRSRLQLTPAMRLKSRVTHIKELQPGQSVSYGCTFTAEKPMKVATVGIGYADGYSRLISNRGYAMIRGKKALSVGRVCMDQCMFDVSGIEQVQVGDEALLFGQETDGLTVDQVAEWMHTINYETVCLITARVPRIYVEE